VVESPSKYLRGAEDGRETPYVDDFLAGEDEVAMALEVKVQLIELLRSV